MQYKLQKRAKKFMAEKIMIQAGLKEKITEAGYGGKLGATKDTAFFGDE